MAAIEDFLKSVGMSEYASGLIDGGFDEAALPRLTETDLERLGFAPADRARLLRAISGVGATPAAPVSPSSGPERRHITILFCDLVGSTSISTRVEPETLLDIIGAFRKACLAAVQEAGGFVAKYVGDGMLAYFGYPRANEDDAERAVNAALALIDSVGRLTDDLGQPLQARAGVASGLVLIGDLIAAGAAHDHDVVGETPNLAARLQARAEPNSVLIGAETRRLIGELFECVSVGAATLKGFADPTEIWRVVGPSETSNRFRALRSANAALIGREGETGMMLAAWERAKAGSGGALLISGEPGIGKSRMAQTLADSLVDPSVVRLHFFCAPNRQTSALYPFITQLRTAADIKRTDTNAERLDKLEALLGDAAVTDAQAAPLMADLLSIPAGGRYPPLDLTPQRRRERTMQTLLNVLEDVAREPTLAIFEDVHWIDPTSLELLTRAIERVRALPVLLVITHRPDFTPPWLGQPHVSAIGLGRLSRAQSAEIVANLTTQSGLSGAMIGEIIDRTDGVPLFIEELTKVLVERGGAARASEIPVTLRDMLTARLDRLGRAKEAAQIASIFGAEFSSRLLSSVMAIDEERLRAELAKLTEAEILFEPAKKGSNSYRFKHALLQEAAYQSLPRGMRQSYHYKVAETIKALQPDVAEAQPEILAHHYAQADHKAEAIASWRAAGEKATQRSANVEATNHFARALELLEATPASGERLQQELQLQLALGTPLIATKGFAAPDVGKVYARAHEICAFVGNVPQLFPVLWGLWVIYTARADHKTARGLAAQCRQIADNAGDGDLLLLARHATGVTLSSLGEHAAALAELEEVIKLYDRERHAALAYVYGQDSGVVCRSQSAFCLWFLGRTDEAMRRNAEALALARELAHPYSLAAALVFSAWIHQLADDRPGVDRDAGAALAISMSHDFVFWLLTGMILRGWALADGATYAEGVATMQQGLAGYQATGAGIMRPYYRALMARVVWKEGRPAEALALLDEAEAAVLATGESWYEPELSRLRGEIALSDAAPASAGDNLKLTEACFEKALATAARQGARSLELRAAVNLARLAGRTGDDAAAKQRLREIFDTCVEGRDTPALVEARALLGL